MVPQVNPNGCPIHRTSQTQQLVDWQNVNASFERPCDNTASHREVDMPEKRHVRGVGEKEQRQYEHIKEAARKSGRYGKRAEEVAARTVLKQHKEKGHRKGH